MNVVGLFLGSVLGGGCSPHVEFSEVTSMSSAGYGGDCAPLPGRLIRAHQAAIAVSLESDRESSVSEGLEVVTDDEGKNSSLVMVEALEGQEIDNIQIRLDGPRGRPVSPTWRLDSIVSTEPVLFRRLDWTFRGVQGHHDLTLHVSYTTGGRTVRYVRPCLLTYPLE
jgi:hypothetical protein